MKVVCIDNSENGFEVYLTVGKWYNIIKNCKYTYHLIDDHGFNTYYLRKRFKTLDVVREEKLNRLL